MKIKIKENAHKIYKARTNINYNIYFDSWYRLLENIAGKEIEVETEHLFINQFNTVPIPNISNIGMRIMIESVEYVINDERYNKMKCTWCGKTQNKGDKCIDCNKNKYLFEFKKEILNMQQKRK